MKVYIGYDSRQDYSEDFPKVVNSPYQVAKYSILKNCEGDISIQPIKLQDMIDDDLYWRDIDPLASTEFTYSRFLTPYLNNYEGVAVFCDSDFLWQCDISELLKFYDEKYSVMCVKHQHIPPEDTKMDGCIQTTYPRKNWSSMVLWKE